MSDPATLEGIVSPTTLDMVSLHKRRTGSWSKPSTPLRDYTWASIPCLNPPFSPCLLPYLLLQEFHFNVRISYLCLWTMLRIILLIVNFMHGGCRMERCCIERRTKQRESVRWSPITQNWRRWRWPGFVGRTMRLSSRCTYSKLHTPSTKCLSIGAWGITLG